ncbi:hypothetical protein HBI56_223240 [Parastagonospora nodorum]|uniref:Uncharacterized protein n=1 Tax=Phaeosphaeria nodorum (strain SN15 / ATCC MYA-4574 / FGSC 10173) TaxID=321614 RepID=A0A7U2EVV5_PHANO|nr:hypothetical protein HBH56_147750 [Parastagonospora nodorum]QRC94058.1 hypothetical protein JI435_405090 [Parastagonospora nodorum SN15]KAH3923296.1 hypothetical protein HBH54_212390 [Parastagonospora nodorum]KAH3946046.1 hypothetical protein HBH53_135210 [Parastagonospora nodorum]KAH3984026.1 hypothetical protein HBH52_064830 [Parastagonospora nodorum]
MQAAGQEPDAEQTCGMIGIIAACYTPVCCIGWLATKCRPRCGEAGEAAAVGELSWLQLKVETRGAGSSVDRTLLNVPSTKSNWSRSHARR